MELRAPEMAQVLTDSQQPESSHSSSSSRSSLRASLRSAEGQHAGSPTGAAALSAPEDATVRYIVEPSESALTVQAYASGVLSSFGHDPTIAVPDFEGEVFVRPDALEESTLRLVIHAASLRSTNEIKQKDKEEIDRKMHAEVLETASFRQIVYECSNLSANKISEGQYGIVLNGGLTLRGVARNQMVSARVFWNGDSLRATGEVALRQSQYGIRPVSAAGGTIRLRDEIRLSFDIRARKKG